MRKLTISALFFTLLFVTLSLSACNKSSDGPKPATEPTKDPTESLIPKDWSITEATDDSITFHRMLENPSSGALLSTYLVVPKDESEASFKTVFLIPGGLDYGSATYDGNTKTEIFLKENDIAYAYFDPDGRGESSGEEDTNGFIQQDGLFAVSKAVAENTAVNADDFGLISFSFGTALASGMLARYVDESPYQWYIDWEGPSAREYVTIGCDAPKDHYMDPGLTTSCSEDEFWSERESVTFLQQISVPYLRVQRIDDHVQASNEHAIDAINAATSGISPWTRINDEDPNQSFTYDNPPRYLRKALVNEYILEMFDLF